METESYKKKTIIRQQGQKFRNVYNLKNKIQQILANLVVKKNLI